MTERGGGGGGWREREERQRAAAAAAADSLETERVWAPMDPLLASLADGSRVAVVTLLGTLCPITLAHVACFQSARELLLGGESPAGRYHGCVGLFGLNPDSSLQYKLPKGHALSFDRRRHLLELATAELPWLGFSPRCCKPGSGKMEAGKLQARWPTLRIEHFTMNGADDVIKYEKWSTRAPEERMITMLRPGCEDQLAAALRQAGIPPGGTADFLLGPTMANVSSTQARDAAQRGDREALLQMLHPDVTDWMLAHHMESGRTTGKRDQAARGAVARDLAPERSRKRPRDAVAPEHESRAEPQAARCAPAVAPADTALSKAALMLVERCPLDAAASDQGRREWAVQVEEAVSSRHSSPQEVNAHLRNLLSNLRSNGVALALYEPAELAALSNAQLAEDSGERRRREATGRALGEDERQWHGSYADPPQVLSPRSAWHATRCSLVLCTRGIDSEAHKALQYYFHGVQRVAVASGGSILAQDGVVDAFISPANTMGNMDGGIDRVYAEHFGWSFGRPFQDVNPLQRAIDEKYGRARAELPIGESVVAPVEPVAVDGPRARTVRFLIAAPTMVTPGPISCGSRIVYTAALAAFRACREQHDQGTVNAVACPMFGTGYGKVPPWVAAAQMWEAFVAAWKI